MPDNHGHVLVVDDNQVNRMMLERDLTQQGHTVATTENGRQALEMLRAEPFDVVLLDILMPEMDGYETLAHIKQDSALWHIPVIMISAVDEMDSVIRCIEMGAADCLSKPFNTALLRARVNASLTNKRLHDVEIALLQQVQKEKQLTDDLLNIVIPIGVELSGESDLNRLLEKILTEAMTLCRADAGTLYVCTGDALKFEIVRNHSLNIALGGTTGQPISFPLLPLYDETTGAPNHHSVATHAALTGNLVNIADAYRAEGFDFSTTKAFDERNGYRTISLLVSPLKNPSGQVIGVLQLINAQDPATGQVIPFDRNLEQMIGSLSLLAAVALDAYSREQRLRQQIAQLQIEIDEAKKARQVAEITDTEYFQSLKSKAKQLRTQRQNKPR